MKRFAKCVDCIHGAGAEFIDGELHVWCTCGASPEDLKTLTDDFEPIRAYKIRDCSDFVMMKHPSRIRPAYEDEINNVQDAEPEAQESVTIGDETFTITMTGNNIRITCKPMEEML